MSTATVPEVQQGYFPHWRLKTTGAIMPEERLPWGQTIVLHLIASISSTSMGAFASHGEVEEPDVGRAP
jgi:putative pyrimidine permease RutG